MISISHIGVHHGEEPVLSAGKGIVNIFFTGCNMRCIYCQNHQISHTPAIEGNLEDYIPRIVALLNQGYDTIGFVSPSHSVSSVELIIKALHAQGYRPTVVYNSNGYDDVRKLERISELIDVYLPDFKYATNQLGFDLSGVKNYYQTALSAIKEMYRQKGSMLICDPNDKAVSGLIIRHLILPGHIDNSLAVLDAIANHISTSVHISLMAQYNPISGIAPSTPLSRRITIDEYNAVLNYMNNLGFHKGWTQQLDSADMLNPDFNKPDPFV